MGYSQPNLTLVLLLSLGVSTLALRCPSPEWIWRRETDSCYFFYGYGIHQNVDVDTLGPWAVRLDWNGVVQECQTRGGILLHTVDQKELDWMYSKLSTRPTFYIGVTAENGRWQWKNTVTNDTTDFSSFAGLTLPATPENRASRGAIKFNNSNKKFEAVEVKENAQLGYICKGSWHTQPRCRTEDGWTFRNNFCYQYNPSNLTFQQATHTCLASGGHIIVPDTDDENVRMRRWMKDTVKTDKVWLGISIEPKTNDTKFEDVKWANDQPWNLPYVGHWEENNLNNYLTYLQNGRNYCGEAVNMVPPEEKYQWMFDDKCWATRPFVCESAINVCPYGWVDFNGDCYIFINAEQKASTRDEAQKTCRDYGANLVAISDAQIQKFIEAAIDRQSLRGGYWIGLKKNAGSSIVWEDETATTFQNWKTPGNLGTGSCTHLGGTVDTSENTRGKWGKSDCNVPLGAICQARTGIPELVPYGNLQPAGFTCPSGYDEIHDGCYKTIARGGLNRDEAQKICEADKATLAYVKTHGENDVVQNYTRKTDSWLGLKIVGRENHTMTGFDNFVYQYSDGTPVDKTVAYMYFADNGTLAVDPDKFRLYCAVMAGDHSDFNTNSHYGPNETARFTPPGRWYHRACSDVLQTAVCYQKGAPLPPKDEEDNHGLDTECGQGWFRNGDYCYQVKRSQPMEWHMAKQTCQNIDPSAELLYITSKEEEIFIRDYVQKNLSQVEADTSYWIDLASLDDGTWYWPYREIRQRQPWYIPFVVLNWADGHPQTFGENERLSGYLEPVYGNTDAGGEWKSGQSATRKGYICKKPVNETATNFNSTNGPDSYERLKCAGGWTSLAGRCVKVSSDKRDWRGADGECKRQGAELFSLRHKRDFNDSQSFPSGSWIGLNSLENSVRPVVFSWSDKSIPLTYTPWSVEPTSAIVGNSSVDFNCGTIIQKGFEMASCMDQRMYICVGQANGGSDGLSGGAIAGIVIGVILSLLLIGGIVFVFMTGRHKVFTASMQTSRMNSTAARGLNNQSYDQTIGAASARNTDRVAFEERFN